jgi:hypothetical protein
METITKPRDDGRQFIVKLLHAFDYKNTRCFVLSRGGLLTLRAFINAKLTSDVAKYLPGITNNIIRGNVCAMHT